MIVRSRAERAQELRDRLAGRTAPDPPAPHPPPRVLRPSRPLAELRCDDRRCGRADHPHTQDAKTPPAGPVEQIDDRPKGRSWRGQPWASMKCRICRRTKPVADFYESGGRVCRRCILDRANAKRRAATAALKAQP